MNRSLPSRRTAAAVFLAAFCLWALNHPMLSIDNHDARIYSILALHWLTPDAYANDPFFLFGSQDSYSLFSPLYGLLVREFGLTVAANVVVLLGAVLWCLAAMALGWGLGLSHWIATMSVLATAVLSINYSPNGTTFLVNEGFATARSIAFPLGGLALAACLYGRMGLAVLCSTIAFLIHPLIGMWAAVIVVLWRLSARQIVVLLGLAMALLLVSMLSEAGPFARFDAEWEHVLRAHTWDVFVANPSDMRWRDYGLQLVLLFAASLHVGASAAGRLYRRVLLVAVSALLVAMFASLIWPSRIVIQAQLWRGMWLPAFFMPFVLCHLLILAASALRSAQGGRPWALVALLAALFMFKDYLFYLLLLWCFFVLASRLQTVARVLYAWGPHMRGLAEARWMPALATGLLVVALPNLWGELGLLEGTVTTAFPLLPQLVGLIFHGGAGLGFALLAWGLVRYGQYAGVTIGLLAVLVVVFLHWDMRSDRDRLWESYAAFGRNDAMTEHIKPGEVVLWDGRMPLHAWYELRTAHYASPVQAIGMVFSREKTFELLARVERIRAAYAYEHSSAVSPERGHAFAFQAPSGHGISLLCQDHALDWVVALPEGAPEIPGGIAVPNPYRGPESFMYLYRCIDFRNDGNASVG